MTKSDAVCFNKSLFLNNEYEIINNKDVTTSESISHEGYTDLYVFLFANFSYTLRIIIVHISRTLFTEIQKFHQ